MAMSVRQFRFLARGSASTSAHQSSPVGSCGCDHDRRPTASRAWGSRQVEVAILQAVAGHRQVLQPHHTSRIIIDEPEKSHSRSDPMKELTSLDRMSGGDIPTLVDGRQSRAAMKAPKRKRLCRSFGVAHRSEF
jgi:hypothetical protein